MTAAEAQVSKQKGQAWLKKFAKWQKPLWIQIIAASLFLIVFRLGFGTWTMAVALIVGMILHELGHAYMFIYYGVQAKFQFIFPLGAVAQPINEEETKKSDELHWFKISWVLLAGLVVNVALIVVGKLLTFTGYPIVSQFGADLAYINVVLAVLNIVPIWLLDAGQLFHVIFSSLKEKMDGILARGLILVSLATIVVLITAFPDTNDIFGILVNVLKRFGPIVLILVSAIGVWQKARGDNPEHANSKQAMSRKQVAIVLGAYAFLVGMLALLA